jgi:hypothetical protein
VGLERGPFSLVSTTEELLGRNSRGSGLESRDYGRRDWSRWSGESSWLQVQRSGFDSRRYQIFWGVVGLERGPLSLVSTTEELLGRKSSGSGLECRGRRNPSRWPRNTLYPQKLALTSPTSGGRSVSIVRLRIQATEFLTVSVKLGKQSMKSLVIWILFRRKNIQCYCILIEFYCPMRSVIQALKLIYIYI